ncbi:hypothetical protein BCR32DRAFT_276478 [Anaeromyces robustus]|jgi:hypothetical protein|uniref:MATH domain-containing protein n=1 Tax=Anaeromyces robustus TaxID=1754192 RepID=A0A1Y1XHL4_9FUNG|nr:hypothetical protein BCR32DRAFT_276478 [Anaeromyces robustus]|eukprot:ORX85182.1 hypothetical protein BCR32DRAFT_276478 [Anaeromyces robustus]
MTYSKLDFTNQLKSQLRDVDHELVGDYFYEWTVDWDKLDKLKCEEEVYSPEFEALGTKWKLMIYPNGIETDHKGFISFYLFRENEDDDCFVHYTVNRVFFVRNCNDYTAYYSKTLPIDYMSKTIIYSGLQRFMNKSNLNIISEYSSKSIIENNKCVFGVYFQIYKNGKDLLRKEISCLLDDEYLKPTNEGIYEWEVKNWSKSSSYSSAEFSQAFYIGDYKWKLELYKDGEGSANKNYVSIYLNCLNPEISKSDSFRVNAVFFIRNEHDPESFYLGYLDYQDYSVDEYSFGHSQLIKKKELFKENKAKKRSVIENGKCIVGVYVHVFGDDLSSAFSKMRINDIEKERDEIKRRLDQSPQQYPPYQYPPPYYYPPPSNGVPPVPNQQYPPYQYPPYQNPPSYYYPPPPNLASSSSGNATENPPPYSPLSMPNANNSNPTSQYPPYSSQPYQNPPYPNPPYPNQPYQNQPYQNPPYPNQPYQPYQNQPYPNQPFYYPPPTTNSVPTPNAPTSTDQKK